jgi:polyvinyl alcohol dehydrogenase (cytochrome)
MRTGMRWGLAAALALVLGGCDWPAYLGGPTHSSFSAADKITTANAGALVKAWTWTPDAGTLPGQPAGGIYAAPTVVNHVIYVGANTGVFYALDEASGRVLWKRLLGFQPTLTCPATGIISTATVVSQPDGAGGFTPIVYVASPDGYLYALNGTNGSTVWRSVVAIPSTAVNDAFNWSSPTVVGDRIYLGFSSNCDDPFIRGGVALFNRTNGSRLATWYGVPAGQKGGGAWTSVAVSNGFAYAATSSADPGVTADSNSLVKLDGSSLQKLGTFHLPPGDATAGDPDFGSSPLVFTASVGGATTELVGACNKNGFWYTLRTSDMSLLWKRKVGTATADGGDACLGGGIFDGSRLFVSGNNTTISGTAYQGSIRQLDPATGNVVWARGLSANVPGPPALDRAGVLVAATHDYIPSGLAQHAYLINAATGSVITTLDNNNAKEFSQPVFADQYLLLTTLNNMYAYHA